MAKKEPNFNGVQWNAAKHEGVTYHTMSVPVPKMKRTPARYSARRSTSPSASVPTRSMSRVGQDNLEAVNKAIDASKAEPNKAVPPFELSASLGQIMQFAAAKTDNEDKRETMQSIADMLEKNAQGRDHVRVRGTFIKNGIKYRLEAEEGVLRAIGKAAMMAQQRAQQRAFQAQ